VCHHWVDALYYNISDYFKNRCRILPAYVKVAIYKKLREKAQSSHFFPLKGRIVPELQVEGIVHYREIIVSPWRIIYKVGSDTVYIMSIIDSRQNLDDLLLKKILSR